MSSKAGLEGVSVGETRLSNPDGNAGTLIVAGYALEEFASRVTFEETVFLLFHDRFPNARERDSWRARIAALREVDDFALDITKRAAANNIPPIDALRMATGTLILPTNGDDFETDALSVIARLPTIIAAHARFQSGHEPIQPNAELSHTANYLQMLTGKQPSAERVRATDTYWNTVADHGMNASTFAARVIVSTDSDLVSATVGAIGALKGSRHGGAPGPVLDMLREIGSTERIEHVLRAKLESGERLMGFGHRVYKTRDPRAAVLSAEAERMYADSGERGLYDLALEVERVAVRLLDEFKPGRNLRTNVEFYTALLLDGIGLPTERFTPTFAAGRVAGWFAHCREQMETGRIIRPTATYVGATGRTLGAS
ncbi:MAG: citrate synthase/methylcitrate synthase [Candidatus Poribacteria bacterium]|nr:citrate synthase/methylcitrate synthase [Candidatus Poribacteria bacterium]